MAEVTLAAGGEVHVALAYPAFVVITDTEIILFTGGDSGRMLWPLPERDPVPRAPVI